MYNQDESMQNRGPAAAVTTTESQDTDSLDSSEDLSP
jgi:hypothetical protein